MHETLVESAHRHARAPDTRSIPRVSVHVAKETSWLVSTLYSPMVGMVLRGAKQVTIGNRTLRYGAGHYFVGSIDVPARSAIIEALPEAPYVAVRLGIDQEILADIDVDIPSDNDGETVAFATGKATPELLDTWFRMLRLLDAPDEIGTLAPLVEREILFRLLRGPQGKVLRKRPANTC